MTRKDYEIIAAAIKAARAVAAASTTADCETGVDLVVRAVGTALSLDNPRFDYTRFVTATVD
jgi:hypothetical protein